MQARSLKSHPKRDEYRRRMRQPIFGRKVYHGPPGCYGVCCGQGTRGGYLCTVCRKYYSTARVCCGYKPVFVNARIRVPPVHALSRWKQFLKRFPQFQFREDLKYVPDAENAIAEQS